MRNRDEDFHFVFTTENMEDSELESGGF